jgi:hypothetical protein
MKKIDAEEQAIKILTELITSYHEFGFKRTEGVFTLEEVGALNHNLFIGKYKELYSAKVILRVSELITEEYIKNIVVESVGNDYELVDTVKRQSSALQEVLLEKIELKMKE